MREGVRRLLRQPAATTTQQMPITSPPQRYNVSQTTQMLIHGLDEGQGEIIARLDEELVKLWKQHRGQEIAGAPNPPAQPKSRSECAAESNFNPIMAVNCFLPHANNYAGVATYNSPKNLIFRQNAPIHPRRGDENFIGAANAFPQWKEATILDRNPKKLAAQTAAASAVTPAHQRAPPKFKPLTSNVAPFISTIHQNNTEDETGSNNIESDDGTCSNNTGLDGGSSSDQSS